MHAGHSIHGSCQRFKRRCLLLYLAASLGVLTAWADETDGTSIGLEQERRTWVFQPPRRVIPPSVKDSSWPDSAIDRFILARIEKADFAPVGDASRETVARRLYFDLVGLPPAPERLAMFLKDSAPDALPRLLDRLIGSPHFGERWGRHWLDVVRFAESSGGGRSLMFKNAWRYRDYVIGAWNKDKPFDQFVREQLAGDLLPADSDHQRAEQLTATGMLALGPTNYEQQDKEFLRMDVIDEQIDTIGRALLGMTLGCARCHDHKFDPVPTEEYYALAGIFGSTKTLVPGNVSRYVERPLPMNPKELARLRMHQQRVEELQQALAEAKDRFEEIDQDENLSSNVDEAKAEIQSFEEQLRSLGEKERGYHRWVMSVSDVDEPRDEPLHVRGLPRRLGRPVPRGVLSVASRPEFAVTSIPSGQSGRLQLAEWIVEPANPLTARVFANRVWQQLLQRGLVSTPDNFGATGERPTHPRLLDYLAMSTVEGGWSAKRLVRQIALSHVYRLSTSDPSSARTHDPENQLYRRANRRQLDAESLRDAMLMVSGQLDSAIGGLSIKKFADYDYGYDFEGNYRRSIYVPRFRGVMLDLFEEFDAANPNLVTGRRNQTTRPTQSLYLMNSPFVMDRATNAARRLLATEGQDDQQRLAAAFRLALGRRPTLAEEEVASHYLADAQQFNSTTTTGGDKNRDLVAWSRVFHMLFACVDFRYVD